MKQPLWQSADVWWNGRRSRPAPTGDSFAAGLMAGLAGGQPLPTAIRRAMDIAARVIQAPGALVPHISEQGGDR
ncbi:MAG: PfkB family carbohydrate kinase [Roseovarius sp.]